MTDNICAELKRRIGAFGARFNEEVATGTRALFRPHLDMTVAEAEEADLAYGPHPRQRLDVYRPARGARAVVVFVHGGGFVAGDKNSGDGYYVNVGRWLARQGFAAVLPNYRLAPGNPWPAGTRDVAEVLAWIGANAAKMEAPAAPVFLLGQSAGACHVASWLFHDEARGGPRRPVAGVMLMSGFYRAEAPLPPPVAAYFGADAAEYANRSPLSHVAPLSIPLWLSVAEFDPALNALQTYALAGALSQANGRSPRFHYFGGHNHVSTVQSLGSPLADAGDEVLRFVNSVLAEQPS